MVSERFFQRYLILFFISLWYALAIGHFPTTPPSTGQAAIDDPMSPYYLHHSDNPGLILVSPVLTGDNYTSWSRAMRIALSIKNKICFIDGSITKPLNTDLNLVNFWVRNNNIVISWLLNSVSKEISASILFAESAAEIWDDLKDRFQQSNDPCIFQLQRDLLSLRQDQDPINVYFTKLKSLWEELNNFRPMCSCGQCNCEGVKKIDAYFSMDYTMTFLMGLNESYAQVRSQILLIDPLPTISRFFSLIVQEERQRAIGAASVNNTSADNMAFAVRSDQAQRSFNSRSSARPNKERPYCTKYEFHGHTVDTCYKIHGYPPGHKLHRHNYGQNHRKKGSYRSNHATANQLSGPYNSNEGSSQNVFKASIKLKWTTS